MVFAGVDPAAEEALVGLDRCVTSGRFLSPPDVVSTRPVGSEGGGTCRSHPDQQHLGDRRDGRDRGAGGTIATCAGERPRPLEAAVSAISWQSRDIGHQPRRCLPRWHRHVVDPLQLAGFRTPGDVAYTQVGPDHLAAASVAQDLEVYASSIPRGIGGHQVTLEDLVSPEARDTWFRTLATTTSSTATTRSTAGSRSPNSSVVRVAFDPLTGFALQTYAPAVVKTADATTWARRGTKPVRQPATLAPDHLGRGALLRRSLPLCRPPGRRLHQRGAGQGAGVDTPSPAARPSWHGWPPASTPPPAWRSTSWSAPAPGRCRSTSRRAVRPAGTDGQRGLGGEGGGSPLLAGGTAPGPGHLQLGAGGGGHPRRETAYLSVRRRRNKSGSARPRLVGSPHRPPVEFEMLLLGLVAALLALGIGMPLAPSVRGIDTADVQFFAAAPLAVDRPWGCRRRSPLGAARRGWLWSAPGPTAMVVRSVAGLAVGDLLNHRRREALLGDRRGGVASVRLAHLLLVIGFAGVLGDYDPGAPTCPGRRGCFTSRNRVVFPLPLDAVGSGTEVITAAYLEREADLAALRALGWPRSSLRTDPLAQAGSIGLDGRHGGWRADPAAIGVAINAAPSAVARSRRASRRARGGAAAVVGRLIGTARLRVRQPACSPPPSRMRTP